MRLTNTVPLFHFKAKEIRDSNYRVEMDFCDPASFTGELYPITDTTKFEVYGINAGKAMGLLTTDMLDFKAGDGIGSAEEKPEFIIKSMPERWSSHMRMILEVL